MLVSGVIYLAATPIGNSKDASLRLRELLQTADVIAAEDSRRAVRLFRDLEIHAPGELISLYDAVEDAKSQELVIRAAAGETIVVISDAGMPTISDPGFRIVSLAIVQGVRVSVVPGPSAVLTALAISGLPVDRFTFEGFLPRKSGERKSVFEELLAEQRTMVFFEAPHRLSETIDDLVDIFGQDRRIAICRELTKTYEEVIRGTLAQAKLWAQGEILGEIVIVLEGSQPISITDESVWIEDIAARVAIGYSQKDAIAEVARSLRIPKREVYDAVVRHNKKHDLENFKYLP